MTDGGGGTVVRPGRAPLPVYLLLGIFFGFLLIRSEVVSWYRIQEMFRFQGFHMYGILGSAVAVAAVSLWLIRRLGVRGGDGDLLSVPPKPFGNGRRYILGGIVFGLGWGLVGACPGPIFALLGHGIAAVGVVLLAALAGTWAYAALQSRLPH